MSHYRVLLSGQNFLVPFEGQVQRLGFFTTRFVEAESAEEAKHAALALLRGDERLRPLNRREDSPRVFFDEVEEIQPSEVPAVTPGFSFFSDEPQKA
jgi:hypothetical protein